MTFSFFFFLVPLVRKIRQDRENKKTKTENFARAIYSAMLEKPDPVDPEALKPSGTEGTPRAWRAVRKRIVDRSAALKGADPVQAPDGHFIYRFTELARELADLEDYRGKVDLSKFEVGKTVFDSD